MKLKNVTYAGALIAAFALSACSNDSDSNIVFGNAVSLKGEIAGFQATRVANGESQWQADDQLGVYMTKSGETVDKAIAANQQYKTSTDGTLTAEGSGLLYPQDGNVDFIAYYPYTATVTNGAIAVDVADQTQHIDLLYAKSANIAPSKDPVNLSFSHKLSYVVLNVTSSDNSDITGLKTVAKGLQTAGSFNLNDQTLTPNSSSIKDITFNSATDGKTFTGIILPTTSVADAKLELSLNGKTVEKALPVSSLESGKKYEIPVDVKGGSEGGTLNVTFGNATITDWTSGTVTGNVDVDFGQGGETPDPDPQPGKETTIFDETFGTVEKKANGYWPAVNEFTGYDNKSLTFSDPQQVAGGFEFSNASVRSTTALDAHVWLPASKDSQLQISGFSTTGYKTLKLTYEITANKASVDQNIIKIYAGDKEITVPSKPISTANKYQTVELTGLPEAITSILFASSKDLNTAGYRIDNIKLVGTK